MPDVERFNRRTTDYVFVERLAQLEEKVRHLQESFEHLQSDIESTKQITHSSHEDIEEILETQKQIKPSIDCIQRLVSAGMVLRWVIIFVIGTLAAIGTTATALDVVRKWIH